MGRLEEAAKAARQLNNASLQQPGSQASRVPGVAAASSTQLAGSPYQCAPAPAKPSLFVLGTHGGAGETSIAKLNPSWAEANHQWPSEPANVLLVARTSATGLEQTHQHIARWASGALPHINIVGLVLINDSHRKMPKPLAALKKLVEAGAPKVWHIGWSDAWRMNDYSQNPSGIDRLLKDLLRS